MRTKNAWGILKKNHLCLSFLTNVIGLSLLLIFVVIILIGHVQVFFHTFNRLVMFLRLFLWVFSKHISLVTALFSWNYTLPSMLCTYYSFANCTIVVAIFFSFFFSGLCVTLTSVFVEKLNGFSDSGILENFVYDNSKFFFSLFCRHHGHCGLHKLRWHEICSKLVMLFFHVVFCGKL